MIYLVDSSCFMTASQKNYPLDIAESFWNKIADLAQNHSFYSIDKVNDEIKAHLDLLSGWCDNNLPDDFFISTETDDVYSKFNELVNWAQNKNINQAGIDKFISADKADIYFIAFASLKPDEYTIVTEEVSAPGSKRDIKLPDACSAFNIRCINFMDMLRELKIKF